MNNEVVRCAARFAKYGSMEECFIDRDRLIMNGAAYSEARRYAADAERFARALAKHWATDPNYADKLVTIYRQDGFETLDASGC